MSYAAPYNPPNYAARAIYDTADDYTRASIAQYKTDEDERKARERTESAERLQRERLEAAMAQVEAKLAPKVQQMDEEYMAARAGKTVPEIQAAREYAKKGQQTRAEWGESYGPGDREEGQGSDRQQYETPESAQAGKTWRDPMVRRGIMESKINPQYWDDAAKGQNEGDKGDMTLRADTIEKAKEGARRVNAEAGRPEERVDDHQQWNPFDPKAPKATTEVGRSTIDKNKRTKGGDGEGDLKTNSAAYASAKETVTDTRSVLDRARSRVEKLEDMQPPEPKEIGERPDERNARITAWKKDQAARIESAKSALKTAEDEHKSAVRTLNEIGQGNKKADRPAVSGGNKPPSASSIPNLPKGGSIGSYVPGKGWQIVVNGKVVAFAQES